MYENWIITFTKRIFWGKYRDEKIHTKFGLSLKGICDRFQV